MVGGRQGRHALAREVGSWTALSRGFSTPVGYGHGGRVSKLDHAHEEGRLQLDCCIQGILYTHWLVLELGGGGEGE